MNIKTSRKENSPQKPPLKIDIITLFPSMFSGPFSESIIHRAQKENKVEINIHNLRDWAIDKRGTVDSRPYGGGKGMVLRPEPIFDAVEDIAGKNQTLTNRHPELARLAARQDSGSDNQIRQIPDQVRNDVRPEGNKPRLSSDNPGLREFGPSTRTILLTPQGQTFNQQKAQEFSELDQLILICGHYEGVDERVREHLVDQEISIGDYILTGGEIPAMAVTDAVTRLLPGVLAKSAISQESFTNSALKSAAFKKGEGTGILEYPQYTKPEEFRGWKVPEFLLSGNHKEIKKWRRRKAVSRTKERRPELLNS